MNIQLPLPVSVSICLSASVQGLCLACPTVSLTTLQPQHMLSAVLGEPELLTAPQAWDFGPLSNPIQAMRPPSIPGTLARPPSC